MKKIIFSAVVSVVLFGGSLFSETQQIVELSASAYIEKCELNSNDSYPGCSLDNPVFGGNIQIALTKTYEGIDREVWSGEWTQEIEQDGVRFLAQIGVDKNITKGQNADSISYTVRGNISLMENSTTPLPVIPGGVSIQIPSLDDLNSISLRGDSVLITEGSAPSTQPKTWIYTGTLLFGPKY